MSDQLQDYRRIVLDCDFVNDWVPPIIASTGDLNGRIIVAKVTNNGSVVTPSEKLHAQLLVNPKPNDDGYFGDYVRMEPVSGYETAAFSCAIPYGAVSKPGRTRMGVAFLADNDDGTQDIICTRPFNVEVEQGVLRFDSDSAIGDFEENVRKAEQAAADAAESAEDAAGSAAAAASSASSAADSAESASGSAEQAATSASNASRSESAAAESASAAKSSANAASGSATAAKQSQDAAASSANSAAESAETASNAATEARNAVDSFGLTVGDTTTSEPGSDAVVTIEKTGTKYVARFTIPRGEQGPRGDKGETGDAATVRIGEVTTGDPGSEAGVTNSGDEHDAVLDIMLPRGDQGPKGDTATVKVGTVTTGEPGSQADVANTGDEHNAVLDFTIPQGVKGDAATVQVGKVATGEPGTDAVVGNSGDEHAVILDFTIPKGKKGDKGDGLRIDYAAASSGELPTSGVTEGQTGIVNGELFVWDGSQWSSQGQMQGAKGDPGVTPNITLTASVDANVGTPSVNVTKSGTPENPTFDIALHNLKGGVNTVTHDATLTGDGTAGMPLGIINGLNFSSFNTELTWSTPLSSVTAPGLYRITGNPQDSSDGDIPDFIKDYIDVTAIMFIYKNGSGSLRIIYVEYARGIGPGQLTFRGFGKTYAADRQTEWIELNPDIPTDYVSDSELASKLAGYVTSQSLTSTLNGYATDSELSNGLQAESSEREKQDSLLEQSINGKIAASNVKAGAGIATSVSGSDVTVSASPATINVTFEASLFSEGSLTARKAVSGLGSVNMVSPKASAANIAACQACSPWMADHTDDSSIPAGQVQCTVSSVPTADLEFVITVLKG